MRLKQFKRLTATHKTELFLLATTAIFDLSFGVEKLLAWKGITIDPLWFGLLYLTLGLLVASAGIYNLIKDVGADCIECENCDDTICAKCEDRPWV